MTSIRERFHDALTFRLLLRNSIVSSFRYAACTPIRQVYNIRMKSFNEVKLVPQVMKGDDTIV